MKRSYFLIVLAAVVLAPLSGADINGKWTGQAGEAGQIQFDLKAEGGKLAGSVTIGAVGEKAVAIREGSIRGDAVEFWIEPEYQGQPTKALFKGKVSSDGIRFQMDVPSQNWGTEFDAHRPA
jgi:hypothetical protein